MLEPTQELAGRGRRLMAVLIDAAMGMAVTFPIMAWRGLLEQIRERQPLTPAQEAFSLFLGLAVFLAIHGYLLAKHGQTVGKKLVGIRIVSYASE